METGSSAGPRLRVAGDESNGGSPKKRARRSRKPRGMGMRTRNGCITCRQRHKKCDEVGPLCGHCATSNRTCIWSDSEPNSVSESLADPAVHNVSGYNLSHQFSLSPLQERQISFPSPMVSQSSPMQEKLPTFPSPVASHPSAHSPSTTVGSDFLPPDLASVRWLDLLAADAIEANRGYSRAASPAAVLHFPTFPSGAPAKSSSLISEVGNLDGADKSSWQLDKDIVLKDFETPILRNFVDRVALWLDLFDPFKHFGVYAIRLALRNVGLMKAILALSAQHLYRQKSKDNQHCSIDLNIAVQYYYETLHYVQTALQYNSYAHSEEILATAIVISTYEMLDESDTSWQRHLKGVFWIQRSQDVNGGSGGIRQSVWWAWLRQDLWAAFRERRRCHSFWKPVKDYTELNKDELADRATYLFSQTVNYCADPSNCKASEKTPQARIEKADELLGMLERWKAFLVDEFKPIPTARTGNIFQPIWIHPPKFGTALQLYYFARILIILHRPAMPGFKSYLKSQKSLSEAIAVICGIAIENKDEGSQILSSQCLFGAGLCVQEPSQRAEIITLIEACESRTGWPMSTMREDLNKEWKKVDSDDGDKEGHSPMPA